MIGTIYYKVSRCSKKYLPIRYQIKVQHELNQTLTFTTSCSLPEHTISTISTQKCDHCVIFAIVCGGLSSKESFKFLHCLNFMILPDTGRLKHLLLRCYILCSANLWSSKGHMLCPSVSVLLLLECMALRWHLLSVFYCQCSASHFDGEWCTFSGFYVTHGCLGLTYLCISSSHFLVSLWFLWWKRLLNFKVSNWCQILHGSNPRRLNYLISIGN